MRIIFFGHNRRGVECLEYLLGSQAIEILLVVGHPETDESSIYYCNLKPTAAQHNLQYIAPTNINTSEVRKIFSDLKPDLFVLCGYSQNILKSETYTLAKIAALNVHASLLPAYRGASPLNWALINGETETGYSIIQIDEGIDTGPIIFQEKVQIQLDDDINSLTSKINSKVGPALHHCIVNIETMIANQTVQAVHQGNFYSKRFPKDGQLKFQSMNSTQVRNMVRALRDPFPGAFFCLNGEKYIVDEVQDTAETFKGCAGRVIKILSPTMVIVLCTDKGILLKLKSAINRKRFGNLNEGIDIDG